MEFEKSDYFFYETTRARNTRLTTEHYYPTRSTQQNKITDRSARRELKEIEIEIKSSRRDQCAFDISATFNFTQKDEPQNKRLLSVQLIRTVIRFQHGTRNVLFQYPIKKPD